MGKIYFKTTSYHAEKTLKRCVDSVLNQTYRSEDIIYYICNNPCTQPDPTEAMVREYAAKEPRIRAFYNRENRVMLPENREFIEFHQSLADDDYLCYLDSDDAYETDLLEKIIPFMEENRLDIAACGSVIIDAGSGRQIGSRVFDSTVLLLDPDSFQRDFMLYHRFLRTTWGKVYSGRIARTIYTQEDIYRIYGKPTYGSDTLYVFSAMRHVKRMGFLPGYMHRYYYSPNSGSSEYHCRRPDCDVFRHEAAVQFLSALGPISEKNRRFLAGVYSNAIADTVTALGAQAMPAREKLAECRRIVELPATQESYRRGDDEGLVADSRKKMLSLALDCVDSTDADICADFAAVVEAVSPSCAPIAAEQAPVLALEPRLLDAVADDNREAFLIGLLNLIRLKKYTKKYDLVSMARALSADKPLLREIDDALFLRRYGAVYLSVWKERYLEALDTMTGALLDGEKANETFLQLYLSLAALQNEASAYVFGKIKLAEYKLQHNDPEACRALLDELTEMGAGDADEVAALRARLDGGAGKKG